MLRLVPEGFVANRCRCSAVACTPVGAIYPGRGHLLQCGVFFKGGHWQKSMEGTDVRGGGGIEGEREEREREGEGG